MEVLLPNHQNTTSPEEFCVFLGHKGVRLGYLGETVIRRRTAFSYSAYKHLLHLSELLLPCYVDIG